MIKLNPDEAQDWSQGDILTRWCSVFKGARFYDACPIWSSSGGLRLVCKPGDRAIDRTNLK
ncbi:hypothetical protein OLMES_4323 [Oleiphilus messinensis]|uniref:Uncharacterized protein n=1 Tax=Oleiphilus messinensis TaxID=141451 RepID=A0A1Y0ICZ0_9GAMM|nr:hypothetical protein OLMES_4323 [Oleiphilus messinensis]